MYAGTTVTKNSGQLIGVHQRIDKVARRHFVPLLATATFFPSNAAILHFEGNNGPDGVKRKSPSVDEPWHFIDPSKPEDVAVMAMIADHQHNLAVALKDNNQERAAFEAAWMAHAIVDGLTPAHHFPLADKIEELFGMPHHERSSVREKNIIKGTNRRDTLSKNWQYWGKRGIFMNHFMYEFGVATAILGKGFGKIVIDQTDIDMLKKDGYEKLFNRLLKEVVALKTYEAYTEKGWTRKLARSIRVDLVPLIIKGVVLGWYESIIIKDNLRDNTESLSA